MNTFKKIITFDSQIRPICFALIAGPLRNNKHWFHSRNQTKLQNIKLERFRNSKQEHSTGSYSHVPIIQRFIPGVLVLAASAYIAKNYGYYKEKLQEFFPFVVVATKLGKNLAGQREKYNFIAEVADLAAPAVVYIEIRDTKRIDYYTGQPTPISNGSGFIIDQSGLILTNAHVVIDNNLKNNMSILVKLVDGRTFEGVVENADTQSDLATVRVKGSHLPVLKLGGSTSLKPGEWVVALGSPLALSNTVTCGIISAHRKSEELGLFKKKIVYLQTDASINQGNSGGPLLNLDGEAVGINSMKILPGISFAIPIDHAKAFLTTSSGQKYAQNVRRTRYIGITMMTVTEPMIAELRKRQCSLSVKVREGVLVWKVITESPGER